MSTVFMIVYIWTYASYKGGLQFDVVPMPSLRTCYQAAEAAKRVAKHASVFNVECVEAK